MGIRKVGWMSDRCIFRDSFAHPQQASIERFEVGFDFFGSHVHFTTHSRYEASPTVLAI